MGMSTREIGIEQARKTLGDLANRAAYTGETTYLTRYGRRVAAITPITHQEDTMTTDTVHEVARTGRAYRSGGWELTKSDLIAMTESGDWTGDWDDLTDDAARLVADDLTERRPWSA